MPTTRIQVRKNGSLLVRGCTKLVRASDGKEYETREAMALCRCGASATKPFCDRTHAKVGFTDEKQADRVPDQLDHYEGRDVTIHDNRGICAHAGYCTDGLPNVWRMKTEPWIDPNGASKAEIVETIRKCPSGALSWTENGAAVREWHDTEQILVMPGGPYAIQGGAELEGAAFGTGASREHFTLCRCGKSTNKPFCSGAHWQHTFDDAQEVSAGADEWHDLGPAEALAKQPLQEVTAGGIRIALASVDGRFSAISGTCAHAGGPLGRGTLQDGIVTCPWHGWSFDARTGRHTGGKDAVAVHPVEIRDGHVFINSRSVGGSRREAHRLEREVRREDGPLRIVGISTTNMNRDEPRYSTSDALLEAALEHASTRGAETRRVNLRDLAFRNCEGYYSRSAGSCTWPCTITQVDPNDEMEQVYEALVFWADVVLVSTPIRWGAASALFYKMAERMNCIQNQITIADNVLIRNKVAAFVITGGQDNIQAVAGQMLTFFSELGFHFPQFPFIAHSRGWSAEDMENNVEYVRSSEDLREGARELVDRSLALARTLVDAGAGASTTCRVGRKANPGRPSGPK
jgi:CDGSH-type Zn-finger protein/multimeric flavodoxin WrbA